MISKVAVYLGGKTDGLTGLGMYRDNPTVPVLSFTKYIEGSSFFFRPSDKKAKLAK